MNENTWMQIHTNGASTTFARFYAGQTDSGQPIFVFQKMEVDITGGGHAEIFGEEQYQFASDAAYRLVAAIKDAQ